MGPCGLTSVHFHPPIWLWKWGGKMGSHAGSVQSCLRDYRSPMKPHSFQIFKWNLVGSSMAGMLPVLDNTRQLQCRNRLIETDFDIGPVQLFPISGYRPLMKLTINSSADWLKKDENQRENSTKSTVLQQCEMTSLKPIGKIWWKPTKWRVKCYTKTNCH